MNGIFDGIDKAPTPRLVTCPTCGARMTLKKGAYAYFYGCPNFRVSEESEWMENTDDNTPSHQRPGYAPSCADVIPSEADGTPYSIERRERMRRARHHAHMAFDKIWKGTDAGGRLMTRRDAYKWLRKQLRIRREECHIGMFDEETCADVIRVCTEFIHRAARGAICRKAHLSTYYANRATQQRRVV